jgi:hypothetical protein
MDQVFLKKEVNKLRAATTTIHSISVTILEEALVVKKNSEKRADKQLIPDDISSLKQAVRTLTRQDEQDLPRLRKAVDMLEAYCLKA